MLRVTKLTDYATVVLIAMAKHPDRVHSASELAERAKLELPTVSKVLKPLAQMGLVESFRGVNGGYKLARPPSKIRLIDVVEAIEGRFSMTECAGEHSQCEHESHCGVQTHWRRINDVIADTLRGISLAEMLPKAASRKSIPLQLAQV